MLKRYLLFWFPEFYPCGGWNDLKGAFETIEEVWDFIEKSKDWIGDWQLVDTQIGKEVDYRKPIAAWWDTVG